MHIRPATEGDVAMAPDWLEGVDLRPDRWRDQWTRAVVGFDAGANALLAVGRIFTSRVHDDRYWTEIMVAPHLRRRGHGKRIAEHLATLRPDLRPMCDRGFVGSERVLFSLAASVRTRIKRALLSTCAPQTPPAWLSRGPFKRSAVSTSGSRNFVGPGLTCTRGCTLTGRRSLPDSRDRCWKTLRTWTSFIPASLLLMVKSEPVLSSFLTSPTRLL